MVAEAMDQDLSLIEPRRMNWGKARMPPAGGVGKVVLSIARRVTGIAILNQKDASQRAMSLPEAVQLLDIVRSIFSLYGHRFHLARVNDQEDQDVGGPLAGVLKLLLFDRAGDRAAERTPLQDLVGGDLIDADIPKPLLGQAMGRAVAPPHLLGPVFELPIPPRRLPIVRTMRLQVHIVQNTANRRATDSRHHPLCDRLTCQVLARPMGDVQPFGPGFETGQLNDLRSVQGGKSAAGARRAESALQYRSYRLARNADTPARPCSDRIAAATPLLEPVHLRQSPTCSVHAGLDTRVGFGYVPFAPTGVYHPAQLAVIEAFDHA